MTLSMELVGETQEGQKLCFAVKDTGTGIRMSEIDRLFHAYERADLMKNRNIEGTGLGLAITEQLLHLFGSSVHVDSTYGQGSTFSFEITLQKASSDLAGSENRTDRLAFSAPDAEILVVDDDEMNRLLMDSFLRMSGITADFAGSGEAALEQVKMKDYDLILMDYMMPGMDGLETMERIRAGEQGEGKHTMIAVLTADVTDNIDRKMQERGFDAYLSKPVNLISLEKLLTRLIPGEKVIWAQDEDAEPDISPQQYEAWEGLLGGKGLEPAEGLRLVGGDRAQYLRIAAFFVDTAPADMKNLQEAADEEDADRLRICFHSLKGKAGSVGAKQLQALAEELESRCKGYDLEYALCSLDLVLLMWKRCTEGLGLLLQTEGRDEAEEKQGPDDYDFEDLVEELLKSLCLCEGKKAKAVTGLMQKSEKGKCHMQTLDELDRLIGDMEFEAAMEKGKQEAW